MKIADALHQLDRHQHGLLAQMEAAVALLPLPAAAAQHELAMARWKMVRLLHAYQIFKHTEIFDPAIRSGSAGHVEAATTMKADCIAAGEAFREYVQAWSSVSIADRWDDYRPAMLAMVEQLRRHVARERKTVAALLAGAERTRRLG